LARSGVAFGLGAFRTTAMKRIVLLIPVVCFGLGACEKHDFKETKQLHEHHEPHAENAEHEEHVGDGEH
jgi:hypothetical protein